MLFKESVEKLGQWMRQNDRTDPELAYWIEKYLLFQGTRSFVSLVAGDGYALIDIRVAAVGQDLIGWTEFLHREGVSGDSGHSEPALYVCPILQDYRH